MCIRDSLRLHRGARHLAAVDATGAPLVDLGDVRQRPALLAGLGAALPPGAPARLGPRHRHTRGRGGPGDRDSARPQGHLTAPPGALAPRLLGCCLLYTSDAADDLL